MLTRGSRIVSSPEPASQPSSAKPASLAAQPRMRVLTVVLILVAVVGTAFVIGERSNFGSIGQGGVNAKLLPSEGEQAPEIVTYDTSLNVVKLSDFYGQPVWLNFWGSWCPPCRAEFPEIQQAYSELSDDGLVMLGIAVGEDPNTALEYAELAGGTFPILADPSYLAALIPEDATGALEAARQIAQSYQINNYPTHIFIDRDGTVSNVVISPLSYDRAMEYGREILDSPSPDDAPAPAIPSPMPATPIREDD